MNELTIFYLAIVVWAACYGLAHFVTLEHNAMETLLTISAIAALVAAVAGLFVVF